MRSFLRDYRTELWFFGIFTAAYWVAVQLIEYLLPFVLAMLLALVMKPVYDFLKRRFRFKPAFSATVVTLLIFSVVVFALAFLLYLIIREGIGLFLNYRTVLERTLRDVDIFQSAYKLMISDGFMRRISDVLSALVKLVPMGITFFILTFALSVGFLNRFGVIKRFVLRRLPEHRRTAGESTIDAAYRFLRRFVRSYLILYLITFVEASFIFLLTGVRYPLVIALFTAIADILPILGPGTIYIPMGIAFIFQENYITGITLLVFFLMTVVIRGILEPKIVSDSVKISPLIVLSAIYCSIVSMNVWVMFYIIGLFLSYRILCESGVLKAIKKPTEPMYNAAVRAHTDSTEILREETP